MTNRISHHMEDAFLASLERTGAVRIQSVDELPFTPDPQHSCTYGSVAGAPGIRWSLLLVGVIGIVLPWALITWFVIVLCL